MPNPSTSLDPSTANPRKLIQREKVLVLKERVRQSTYVRFVIIGLCLAIATVDLFLDALDVHWPVFAGMQVPALAANLWVLRQHGRDAVRPWHLWGLMAMDTLTIAIISAVIGKYGYLGMPFLLVASVAYTLAIPRAARVQLLVALVCYPAARAVGFTLEGVPIQFGLLMVETVCLGTLGYLAIAGPMRYTYRVRGARRALASIATGDFGVRLPARALDDLGFLAVSINDTAERLGQTVHALEAEIAERTRAEQELLASREALAHLAFHDPLTGLPNRARFREKIAEAMADDESYAAVLAVDLDGFKGVNDTYGHAAGDAVLVEVATRLLSASRGTDVVTRVGGDEFGVLLRYLRDDKEAIVVAERILSQLSQPVTLGDGSASVGASIGIAVSRPARHRSAAAPAGIGEGGPPVDQLLHAADVALYRAKHLGRGRWCMFDATMTTTVKERRRKIAESPVPTR